jgi:glycosyltransferase involved in cell wall biosynthesis
MVPSILGFANSLLEQGRRVTIVTPTPSRHDLFSHDDRLAFFGPVTHLRPIVERAEVVHIHGLWQTQTRQGAASARRAFVPYVISAHGMADPWALSHKRWKKLFYMRLVELRNLSLSSCLHALAWPEVEALRSLCPRTPIALIPNGVDLKPFQSLPDRARGERERFNLLFYGRLHRKKGLDLVAGALEELAREYPQLHLLLAGRDDGARGPFLQRIREAGLGDRVTNLGHVSGARALHVWASADAFILPSYSEGFSMAVLEALAAQLPVVISTACNFPELAAADGGIVVEANQAAFVRGLRQLLERSATERYELGQRGRKLIERSYTWDEMGKRLAAVYRWLLGGGDRPDTVVAG